MKYKDNMGLFSSTTKTTQKTDMSSAAKWQEPYLKDAMSSAQNTFKDKLGSNWFGGPTHAGLDPLTTQAIDGVKSYATGGGAQASDRVGLVSMGLMGSSGNYLDQIGKLAIGAANDPTQGNIAAAKGYSDNPALTGMIDAASRDIGRNLRENVMPSIDRDATATGGINSSRAGVAEGIAMRGAQDAVGDIAATMRGAAYADGLTLAENARQANMSATGQAAGLFGSALQQGLDSAQQGQTMTYNNLSKLDASGQIMQAENQSAMDDALNRWTQNDNRDAGALSQYMNIVGGQSWGEHGTTVKTEKTNPGVLQSALGAAAMVKGFPGLSALAGGGLGSFASGLPSIAPSVLSQGSIANFPTANIAPLKLPRL